MLVSFSGCSGCLRRPPAGVSEDPCGQVELTRPHSDGDTIELAALQDFSRCDGPVLRDDEVADESEYEAASDGHVFFDADGALRMIYSGDIEGFAGPKLATGTDWDIWEREGAVMAPAGEDDPDRYKETPFYRVASDGTHQLFYIGYPEEEEYQSQIYLATSDTLEGPYVRTGDPVVPRGEQDGKDVYLMTSPSVVEHEGELFMVYLAWNDSPRRVDTVWVMAATSSDDGYTWGDIREVEVPVGMEGQITKGPDGKFYATSMRGYERTEAIFLARADHPLGPYEDLPDPLLVKEGRPWEIHEANAPQVAFDPETRTAYLFYVGASYLFGWWVMLAKTAY